MRLTFWKHFRPGYVPELLHGDANLLEAYRDGFEAGRWGRPPEAPFVMPPSLQRLVEEGKADYAMTVRIFEQVVLEWHIAYAEAHLKVRRAAWLRAMKAQDDANGLAA